MAAHAVEARQTFIGQSPQARQIARQVAKLARGRWPVLILGETGTGKEVAARAIHNANPAGPFVPIDCSSLAGPLMESELFGYTRGAFTGAVSPKAGLIEAASGGTAFFDEIGELPLDMQVKLLRVLQEKEFRPVGALAARKSDFRVIAATNRDIAREVEKGAFRRDLFFRLNVVSLRLAPLRDRKEDIPPLIDHFLERQGSTQRLTAETLELMMSYDWPGNVRELENCMQRLAAMESGPLFEVSGLPSMIQNHALARVLDIHNAPPAAEPAYGPAAIGGVRPLHEVERRAILDSLAYTRGDRAAAALLLGIGRTTLYRKLKEYEAARSSASPAPKSDMLAD